MFYGKYLKNVGNLCFPSTLGQKLLSGIFMNVMLFENDLQSLRIK